MKDDLSIVIISDARLNKRVTLDCLNSLRGQNIHEIIVVESDPNTEYTGVTKTIHPTQPFNYNLYLNIGAKEATGFYIAFCNNDLLFENGWWTRLFQSMTRHNALSASPICPNTHKEFGFSVGDKVVVGSSIRQHIAGWCIVLDRVWYLSMGGFDERFSFWCADNSYGKQLESRNQKHILDCNSVVHHVQSASLDKLDDRTKDNYTFQQVKKFNKEFGENIFNLKE